MRFLPICPFACTRKKTQNILIQAFPNETVILIQIISGFWLLFVHWLFSLNKLLRSYGVVGLSPVIHTDSPGSIFACTTWLETLGKFLKRYCLSLAQAYGWWVINWWLGVSIKPIKNICPQITIIKISVYWE